MEVQAAESTLIAPNRRKRLGPTIRVLAAAAGLSLLAACGGGSADTNDATAEQPRVAIDIPPDATSDVYVDGERRLTLVGGKFTQLVQRCGGENNRDLVNFGTNDTTGAAQEVINANNPACLDGQLTPEDGL